MPLLSPQQDLDCLISYRVYRVDTAHVEGTVIPSTGGRVIYGKYDACVRVSADLCN